MQNKKPLRIVILCVFIEFPGRLVERFFLPFFSFLFSLPVIKPLVNKFWSRFKSRWLAVIWYNRFAEMLAEAYRKAGHDAEVKMCRWGSVAPKLVNKLDADVVLVPHKQHWEFPNTNKLVLYYNQAIFRWLFTVDSKGWAAGSSEYPCQFGAGDAKSDAFDEYKAYLQSNKSKYIQPDRASKQELLDKGVIPDGDYIFFPCQIPTDKNLQYFSELPHDQIVATLVEWANAKKQHIVFKPHPQNPNHEQLPKIVTGDYAWLLEGDKNVSVHDVIEYSKAVFTINSGVGLESVIAGKPVVTFGKCEYDCVTVHGNADSLESIDAAFNEAAAKQPDAMMKEYRQFVDWFCNHYVVDMNDEENLEQRLQYMVQKTERLFSS